jgi:sugar lactone lactonase YvrE
MKTIIKHIYSTFAVIILGIGAITANADPGDIFVSISISDSIYKYHPDGTGGTVFSTTPGNAGGLAFDSVGNLFAGDADYGNIYKIPPDGIQSTFAIGLSEPYGLAFDTAGNLFAADIVSGTIYKYAPDGTPSTFTTGVNSPTALAFDGTGNLFVVEYQSGRIYKYAPDGTPSTFATGPIDSVGLAFDSAGNLFEPDFLGGTIVKYAPDGTPSTFATGLSSPAGLAFDASGYLFVAEHYSGNIYKFAPNNGTPIAFLYGLSYATFVAIQPPAPTPTPTPSPSPTPTSTPTPTPTPSYSAQIQQPINSDGSSVFSVRRGVVPVKFTLSQGGNHTCTLPPATIALTRTSGGTIGSIDENVYVGPADTGSNFRVDNCQYVYNLTASALGVGTYRVDILINGQAVGSGMFQLK